MLVGDVFDLFFKANRKNLAIILDHFGGTRRWEADGADCPPTPLSL